MNKIRLSKCQMGNAEKEAVLGVLDNEYLGMGEEVKKFENKIKEFLKTELEVVCVNTGTSALHLALHCLGVKAGDEVLVPSITYVASFQAISAIGAIPVACDVDPKTIFIDANGARSRITPKTKAIMPVHYASSSKGMEKIYELAKEFNLRVVEDAAQAFGSKRNGKLIGSCGDIVCFSFDGIKNISCGEGGAILTSDLALAEKLRDARLLGVLKDTEKRYQGQRSWDFDVLEQGFRYHMSNINAGIGLAQIDRIGDFCAKRQKIAKKYKKGLSDVVGILDFDFSEIMPHIFVIKAQKRDELKEYLSLHNIETGIHYKPNHLLSKYKSNVKMLNAEQLYKEILTLPCHVDLSDDEQEYVIKKIKEFYAIASGGGQTRTAE